MKIKRRKKRIFPESSATSDIAFLLIIYFIVIAGFNINKGFLMNLPAKDSTRLVKKDDVLRYQLDESGNVLFNGEPRSMRDAEVDIRSAVNASPNLALMLIISPKAPWQNVVSFVEMAENLNVDSFSFRIEKPEDSEL
ncbi:MAG: biopolymer transporter ExbD [Spirochaetaceae bacterium]|jgi:biopolymer transport protein ExbD|nr:biopolymer transporter ExbD [Spirochaetaceae bacterium]